jgi:hypothetical protein
VTSLAVVLVARFVLFLYSEGVRSRRWFREIHFKLPFNRCIKQTLVICSVLVLISDFKQNEVLLLLLFLLRNVVDAVRKA